jgi:cytochrome c oxidase subunit 3
MSAAVATPGAGSSAGEAVTQRVHAFRVAVWIVVASEALLFAALAALYVGYRAEYAHAFARGTRIDIGWMGGVNTLVLLTSSFAMAAGIHAAHAQRPRVARRWLAAVLALGAVFLILKGAEWTVHVRDGIVPGALLAERGLGLFVTLYYLMTGLHALHLVAGMLLVTWVRHRGDPDITECVGVYWHFVDVVWVFLWPMFYLLHG